MKQNLSDVETTAPVISSLVELPGLEKLSPQSENSCDTPFISDMALQHYLLPNNFFSALPVKTHTLLFRNNFT
jgi:hypothetical protein